MEKFFEIIITTSAGSFIALIGVMINNRYLLKVENRRFDHENQKQINYDKRQFDQKRFFDFQINIKQAHFLISQIESEISTTASTIHHEANLKPNQFNEFYASELSRKIHELESIMNVYSPDFHDQVRKLSGLANNFGEHQKLLLRDNSLNSTVVKSITEIVNETYKVTSKLKSELMKAQLSRVS